MSRWSGSRPARRSNSIRSIPRAARSPPNRRSPTSRHSISPRSIRWPVPSISTAPSPAMRSRSRFSPSRPRAGAGPPTFRASGCSPTSSRIRPFISGNMTRSALQPAMYGPGGRVPLKPFCGTIGLAPAEPGLHSIVPPRRMGGNMDIRDLSAGTELYLPVEVQGRPVQRRRHPCDARRWRSLRHRHRKPLLAGGEVRSHQGRQSRIPALHDARARWRAISTTRAMRRRPASVPISMEAAQPGGHGHDRSSVSKRHRMSAVEAYMLCSVAGDLRISEIVDMPNWVVSFYFPRLVFE